MDWLNIWLGVLALSFSSFLLMMIVIGSGAVKELKMTLDELRTDTQETQNHPEILDEKT